MVGIFDRIANETAQQVLNRVPQKVKDNLPLAKVLISGDPEAIASEGLGRLFGKNFGLGSSFPPQPGAYYNDASPLLGGISPAEAKKIFDQISSIKYCKKNLFYIQIQDFTKGAYSPAVFNLFATDVGYTPYTITGDTVQIGGGSFDVPKQSERVEMRITTLDDQYGSIKRWFEERALNVVHQDGTNGLPIEYLSRITILHGFVSSDVYGAISAYKNSYVMRPGTMEFENSRREDAMQEIQLNFVQFDTFTAL